MRADGMSYRQIAPHVMRLAGAVASGLTMGVDADLAVLDVLVEAENWREEMNTLTDLIPYHRPLMGFHRLALANMGL